MTTSLKTLMRAVYLKRAAPAFDFGHELFSNTPPDKNAIAIFSQSRDNAKSVFELV